MQGIALTVFGWMAALVAVIAWMAGPAAAADFAGNSMRTIGVTVGSIVHGIPAAIAGFKDTESPGPNHKTGTKNHT